MDTAADLARIWGRDSSTDGIEIFPYPKSSESLRELAVVTAKDHARLRSASVTVAEAIARKPTKHCYSAKFATRPPNWSFSSHLYFRFIRAAMKGVKAWDCVGAVRTDVQAYFPNIRIEALLRLLWDAGCDRDAVRFIVQTLLGWQDTCARLRGLPIGPEACALLGSFFLNPVDDMLEGRVRALYRYMDDMVYLYGSDLAADRGLGLLDEALASRGLTRSRVKTNCADSPTDAMDLLRRRDLTYVEAYIQLIPDVPIDPVKEFFDEMVLHSSPVDLAGLHKCLSAFLSAKDPYAVYPLLDTPTMFDSDPRACGNYLANFVSNTDIARAIARRLNLSDVPAASRLHMIRVLSMAKVDKPLGNALLRIAETGIGATPERVWAVAAYGHSDAFRLVDLLDALSGIGEREINRAAILSLRSTNERGRRYAARVLSRDSSELQLSADWALAA